MADIAKLIYKGNILQAGGAGSIVPSEEPSNPAIGQLRYDIENATIYIWDGEEWAYIGGVTPKPTYLTYTISWTENEDPTVVQNSVVYSDDAVGLQTGSVEFDKFFGYYGCRVDGSTLKRYNWAGTEITDDSVYDYSTLVQPNMPTSGLDSGNDVMVCFPRRGIKMSKTGSVITLSITSNPDYSAAIDEGYQYYAFTKGTWADHNAKNNIQERTFIGVYEGWVNNNNLYSYSGKTPSSGNSGYSTSNFWTYANNRSSANASMMRWYHREYVNCLYMMKYGNPNSQATIGNGIVSGSKQDTGGANSLSTNGTPSGGTTANQTTACRLFGIENRWGNLSEWCVGLHTTSGNTNVATALWKNDKDATTETDNTYYQNIGVGSAIGSNGRPSLTMAGTNKGMFVGTSVYGEQNWSKGYCDWSRVNAGSIAHVGGYSSGGLYAGAFYLDVYYSPSDSHARTGSRLVYL